MSDRRHLLEALSGAAAALVLKVVGAVIVFALNILIARALGVEGAGLYFMALSVVMIASVLARVGMDVPLIKFIAASAARQEHGRIQSIYRSGVLTVALGSGTLSIALFMATEPLASGLFGAPDLVQPLRVMALGVISFSLMTIIAESLKGLHRVALSVLVSAIFYPLVTIALVWPLCIHFGPAGAGIAFVTGTAIAGLVASVFWKKFQPVSQGELFPYAKLWKSAHPLWVMSIVNRGLMPWGPLFMLGIWWTAEDSGVFGAATRISAILSMLLIAVNMSLAPKFSELYAQGKIRSMETVARRFALLVTVGASPLFVLFLLAGDRVLALFGPGFEVGHFALAILVVGQIANVVCGSVAYILIMAGQESDVRFATIVSAVVLLVLGWLLIPSLGMEGAALAASASVIVNNLIGFAFVYSRLRIVTIPFLPRRRVAVE
ncbi:oligosaccharide flippase family protein [Wenzhouxiangella sp. XN201]|uniref:oligosaccharide flippase family protein n=1 Tax=Wenzhouxiangella sp. XN201 TaxID=2710755 RepID=UPI0013CD3D11|nr:polysaccharide biosynthesis C-terminal domain-containing protein [Wenzhouxiangella sp. XN201]NEZ04114.1 oligosaccharide flippase family protein [Wenzhouxiangella sp. XN201]